MRFATAGTVLFCVFLAACGGSGGSTPATQSPTPTPGPLLGSEGPANPSFELPVPSLAQGDDWTTYAHDTYRTGFEAAPTGATQANVAKMALQWTFKSSYEFLASPIVSSGTVYVVDINGNLTALDAKTGTVKWQRQLGYSVAMTPSIYDGVLFVGTHNAPTSQLTALDPLTGNILWQQSVPGGLQGSPLAVNGTLYVGVGLGDPGLCRPGGLFTFAEHTGAPGPYWLTESPADQDDGGGVWGPISYDGSRIVYGTGNTCQNAPKLANAVVAVSPDLATLWSYQTSPALNDDDVGGGVMVLGKNGYVIGKTGFLYAFDLPTGIALWKTNLGAIDGYGGHATPSYTEGTLIVSGGYPVPATGAPGQVPTGTLYGLGQNGGVKWKITAHYPPASSYVATTPDLAFAELDNSIQALEPSSGKTLWSYTTLGNFSGGPAITQSGLFAADLSGTVYAFGISSSSSSSQRRGQAGAIRGFSKYKPTMPPYCKV